MNLIDRAKIWLGWAVTVTPASGTCSFWNGCSQFGPYVVIDSIGFKNFRDTLTPKFWHKTEYCEQPK